MTPWARLVAGSTCLSGGLAAAGWVTARPQPQRAHCEAGSAAPASASGTADQVPIDKLACRVGAGPGAGREYKPVVLLACGSFNPPTNAHLRMFHLAAQALTRTGHDVLGGYLSPVGDAYGKPGLAPAQHRVAMCAAAAATSPLVMADAWESSQPAYQRSLVVLQRLEDDLNRQLGLGLGPGPAPGAGNPSRVTSGSTEASASSGGAAQRSAAGAAAAGLGLGAQTAAAAAGSGAAAAAGSGAAAAAGSGAAEIGASVVAAGAGGRAEAARPPRVRCLLLCGADLLQSFATPGVWKPEHVERIVRDHGVVCIHRPTYDLEELLGREGSPLHALREGILLVTDPVPSSLSSTAVREQVAQGNCIDYLTPSAVVDYIRMHKLYQPG